MLRVGLVKIIDQCRLVRLIGLMGLIRCSGTGNCECDDDDPLLEIQHDRMEFCKVIKVRGIARSINDKVSKIMKPNFNSSVIV